MSNVFFIGDTHFGHKKVAQFEPDHRTFASVEEHDETLVERWNSVVRKRDVVWHLGDVLFAADRFPLLARLHGHKKLILGNHDTWPVTRYAKYFGTIKAYEKFDGAILSHIPIHPDQFYRWKANIHGHLHSKQVTKTKGYVGVMAATYPDDRYVNVSAEHNNLTPISYEDLKKKHEVLRETS